MSTSAGGDGTNVTTHREGKRRPPGRFTNHQRLAAACDSRPPGPLNGAQTAEDEIVWDITVEDVAGLEVEEA